MSVKISCWASYFTQKKSFFLARTWHAHAFPGILAFLLSQPSHGIVGTAVFSTRKKGEKATFTECHASKQQRTFKNVGRISKKVRRFFGKCRRKKEKNVGDFSEKRRSFLGERWRFFSRPPSLLPLPLEIILRPSKREGKINYHFINISALSRARVCAHISDFVLFAFTTFTHFIAISYNSDRYTAFYALLVSFFRKSSQERNREYVKKCPKDCNN